MIIENVEIRVINAVREGISKSTGMAWKSQEVVVAWKEKLSDGHEAENRTTATLFGEMVDKFAAMNLNVGSVTTVDIAFSTRSFNERVYCDNRLFV